MYICDECGRNFVITDEGISNHIDDDGNYDYDMDADHVAICRENEL